MGRGRHWDKRMIASALLVTNEYPPERIAGTAINTQFVAEELAARDFRVTVVVNTRQHAPAREVEGPLEVVRLRPLGMPMTRMAQRVALLVGIARRRRPDVMYGTALSSGFLALATGRCLGIPAVTNVAGYDLYASSPWARHTYIRWALAGSEGLTAHTADLAARAFALSGRRPEIVTPGLKLRPAHQIDRRAARALLALPDANRIVLYAGRLSPEKGVGWLLRAFPQVIASCPDAHLVLVGDGPQRNELMALARTLGLEGAIFFAGLQEHETVIRYMRAADLFVLPSLQEPFGIVLLEAMSCGLPVVASNVMGIPSIVEDPANGYLVPPRDAAALADRIIRFLQAPPAEGAALAERNIAKAARYSIPRIVDRLLAVWDGAAAARRARRSVEVG
jgi:glycosyltransferase involved in cell wall biosynthesis